MAISLSGWIERRVIQPEKTSQPEPLISDQVLNGLTLRLAACHHLAVDLPTVLTWLQRQLPATYTAIEGSCLCLALRMSQAHSLTLVTPSGITLTVDQATAMEAALTTRYRRTDDLVNGSREIPSQRQLPCWPHPLYAQQLTLDKKAEAWLLLPGGWPQNPFFEPLRRAFMEGLKICLAHHQHLEQAVEEERRDYAAGLHDTIAQELGYLRLRTSRLEKACRQLAPELETLASDIHLQTQRTYRQTRELITTARLTLEDDSLHLGLVRTVEEFEQLSGLVFELDNRAQPEGLSRQTAIQVLLIVREALSNSVRHSHASHVRIQLFPQVKGELLVRVDDNGRGIISEDAGSGSFGLGIMHERAQKIGGHLHVRSLSSGGTRVELIVTDDR